MSVDWNSPTGLEIKVPLPQTSDSTPIPTPNASLDSKNPLRQKLEIEQKPSVKE